MGDSNNRTIQDWKTSWICSACGRENGVDIDACPGCGLQQKLSFQLGLQKGIVSPDEAIFFEQRQIEKENKKKEDELKKQQEEERKEKAREEAQRRIEQENNKQLQGKAAFVFVFNLLALLLFPRLISGISGEKYDSDAIATSMVLHLILVIVVIICICVAIRIIKIGKGGKGLAIASLVLGIIAIIIYAKELSALARLLDAYDSVRNYMEY